MRGVNLIAVLTRSPFSNLRPFTSLASKLAGQVSSVKIYLFYDGVLAAKKGASVEAEVRELTQKGVTVIVDGREFRARGLGPMVEGVKALDHPVSELVDDIMEENSRVILV